MNDFREGNKVRVKGQPASPFHGKVGTIVRSHIYGLAPVYEVAFDQFINHLSPANRFLEFDLELVHN
ncbi:hypothetical protein ACFLXA_05040 [Chloroflexota bacterium]